MPRNADFNGAKQDGFGLYQVTQHDGERWSAARAYVDPLEGKPNLNDRTGALIEKIIVGDGRATGGGIRRFGKRREVLRAKAGVILSAGAFGSPQIMMLSGLGPGGHLQENGIETLRDKAAVGADLQDHFDYLVGYDLDDLSLFGGSLRGTFAVAKAFFEHGCIVPGC